MFTVCISTIASFIHCLSKIADEGRIVLNFFFNQRTFLNNNNNNNDGFLFEIMAAQLPWLPVIDFKEMFKVCGHLAPCVDVFVEGANMCKTLGCPRKQNLHNWNTYIYT